MISKTWGLLFAVFTLSGTPTKVHAEYEDPYHELKRGLSKTMRKDLDAELKSFMRAQGLDPIKYPVKTSLYVRLGHEQTENRKSYHSPTSFLAAVYVRLDLLFDLTDPSLDLVFKKFVLSYFEKRGMTRHALLKPNTPVVQVWVRVRPPRYSMVSELQAATVRLAFALLCLLLIVFISSLGRRGISISMGRTVRTPRMPMQIPAPPPAPPVAPAEPSVDLSNLESLAVSGPYAQQAIVEHFSRLRKHPTPSLQKIQHATVFGNVDPTQGTWYIHAIPQIPTEKLERVFKSMPFEEAVVLLRSFSKGHREEVVRRLDLLPAVKTRVATKSAGPTNE